MWRDELGASKNQKKASEAGAEEWTEEEWGETEEIPQTLKRHNKAVYSWETIEGLK